MSDEASLIGVERLYAFGLLGRCGDRQATEDFPSKDARHLSDRLELGVSQMRELTSIHLDHWSQRIQVVNLPA
ncbi:hypothetical protein C7G63_18835 [Acinetobacter baumannii]|nr:hypothetical protein C7G63_18835 [Acinetobacter baumannii]